MSDLHSVLPKHGPIEATNEKVGLFGTLKRIPCSQSTAPLKLVLDPAQSLEAAHSVLPKHGPIEAICLGIRRASMHSIPCSQSTAPLKQSSLPVSPLRAPAFRAPKA